MRIAVNFRRAAIVTFGLGIWPGCSGNSEYYSAKEAGRDPRPLSLANDVPLPKPSGDLLSSPTLGGSEPQPTGSGGSTVPAIIDPRLLTNDRSQLSIRDSLTAIETELGRSAIGGAPLQAIPDLRRAVGARGNPDYDADLERGAKLLEQKKYAEALACFATAQKLEPNDHRAYLAAAVGNAQSAQADRGAYEREMGLALAQVDVALREGRLNFDRAPLDRGLDHARKGNISEALQEFRRHLTTYADPLETPGAEGSGYKAEFDRGMKLLEQKKIDEALVCFESTQKLKTDDHRAYFGAAVCRLHRAQSAFDARRTQLSSAIAEMAVAIRTAPQLEQLYLQRGHIYAAMGRNAEAIGDFTRYLDARPDDADALIARGMAALEHRQPLITIADADALHKLQPRLPDALLLRAMGNFVLFIVRLQENQRDEAERCRGRARRDFDESVKMGLDPKSAAFYRRVFYQE